MFEVEKRAQELQFRIEEKDKEIEKMRQEVATSLRNKKLALEQIKNLNERERQSIRDEL